MLHSTKPGGLLTHVATGLFAVRVGAGNPIKCQTKAMATGVRVASEYEFVLGCGSGREGG